MGGAVTSFPDMNFAKERTVNDVVCEADSLTVIGAKVWDVIASLPKIEEAAEQIFLSRRGVLSVSCGTEPHSRIRTKNSSVSWVVPRGQVSAGGPESTGVERQVTDAMERVCDLNISRYMGSLEFREDTWINSTWNLALSLVRGNCSSEALKCSGAIGHVLRKSSVGVSVSSPCSKLGIGRIGQVTRTNSTHVTIGGPGIKTTHLGIAAFVPKCSGQAHEGPRSYTWLKCLGKSLSPE